MGIGNEVVRTGTISERQRSSPDISIVSSEIRALVTVWQSAGFAIGRLQVRISAGATSYRVLLSLPSFRGR